MRALIRGQCFCGHIQIEANREPISACHCHCESCQRASGAPFVTWVTFPFDHFNVTKGALVERQSSPGVTRGHCGECGTTMTYYNEKQADEIDVAATCLDQPATIRPTKHLWVEDRQPWIVIGDDLPQYEQTSSSG